MENRDRPANPVYRHNQLVGDPEGLTKREWFAGMALQGFLSGNPRIPTDVSDERITDHVAGSVLMMADALLRKLDKEAR